METKRCTKCGETKTVEKWPRKKDHSTGLHPWCRQCIRAGWNRWADRDRQRIREQRRDYRERNKEQILAAKREYHHRFPKTPEYKRRRREQRRARYKQCPAKNIAQVCLRQALKKSVTVGDPKLIEAFYRHVSTAPRLRCHYCKRVTRKADRQVDHIISLAKGGKHCVSNLCCSCRPCNQRKGKKTDEEFTGQLNLLRRDGAA